MDSRSDVKKRNKKKKKSFSQRAKKLGQLSRGNEIERDTYDYFLGVAETLERQDTTSEEEALLAANAFRQTEGEEVRLCGNQLTSRILERLLPRSTYEVRERFMSALAEDLRLTSTDAFASHVLEKLLFMAAGLDAELEGKVDDGNEDGFDAFKHIWLLKVCKFVVNNSLEFAQDRYASHVLRTAYQCLAGIRLRGEAVRSKRWRSSTEKGGREKTEEVKLEKADRDFFQALTDAAKLIRDSEDISVLLGDDNFAGAVQVLLAVLAKVLPEDHKKVSKYLLRIISADAQVKQNESNDVDIPELFHYEPLNRFLEVLIETNKNDDKLFKKIVDSLFSGHLGKLSLHPKANYPVQKLLHSCSDKEMFESWYADELDENIEEILACGHTGIVLALAQACRRLETKQAHFIVSLARSFHCYEATYQDMLVPLLLRMVTREEYTNSSDEINLHGSLVVQEMLNFAKPIKIVKSILSLKIQELKKVMSDPKGCHVVDAFMNSKTVGEKSREGLVRALHGELVSLSCSKYGSRAVQAMWKKSSLRVKESLASELSVKEPMLKSNPFGKFVSSQCALSVFKRSKEEWKQTLERTSKRKGELMDFLGEMNRKKDEDSTKRGPDVSESKRRKPNAAKSYLDDL